MTDKLTSTGQCPHCGATATIEHWTSAERIFETAECSSCGQIHGRIIGATWSGSWHYLGLSEAHALKLSRRPNTVYTHLEDERG